MTRFLVRRLGAGVIQVVAVTFLAWVLFFVIARFTGASPAVRVAGRNPTPQRDRRGQQADRHRSSLLAAVSQVPVGGPARRLRLLVRPEPLGVLDHPASRRGDGIAGDRRGDGVDAHRRPSRRLRRVLHPRSTGDVTVRVVAVIGMSIPIFWLAPMFSYLFAYQPTQGLLFGFKVLPEGTRIFPIDGYVPPTEDPWEWMHHLMLPWLALATTFAAIYIRYVRTLTIEQLQDDYVRTGRAKGMSQRRLLVRHVGRNVAPVLILLLGLDIGIALGGTLFVETVFNIPGLGYTGLHTIQSLDYPLVTGVITFTAIVAVLATTAVDLFHALLDPHVRAAQAPT